jgi:hypothetical protein
MEKPLQITGLGEACAAFPARYCTKVVGQRQSRHHYAQVPGMTIGLHGGLA